MVRNAIINRPFAVMPQRFGALFETMRAQGGKPAAVLPRGGAIAPRNRSSSKIAILPLFGFLSQRLNPMDFAGDTSLEAFGAVFNQVLQDPYIDSIVIEVDSPGGSVYGVDELAARIFAARGRKRIAAIANSLSTSAAYWIATAAGQLSCTPSGEVGSIGIVAIHQDWSRAEDAAGVDVTLISAGKYKTEGNEHEPLGDTARGALQNRVDQYYGMFVRAVARHRAATIADVSHGFGEGRTVGAADALKMGMVDRVETREQLVHRLASTPASAATQRATAQDQVRAARVRLHDARERVR